MCGVVCAPASAAWHQTSTPESKPVAAWGQASRWRTPVGPRTGFMAFAPESAAGPGEVGSRPCRCPGGRRPRASGTRGLLCSVERGSQGLPAPCCRGLGSVLEDPGTLPPPPGQALRPGPRWVEPPRVSCSGRSTASTGLRLTNGELIATLDSQVYKYVKSILIVFSQTGKESIFSDAASTVLTGAVVGGPRECRAPVRRSGRAFVQTSPGPVTGACPEPY